MNYDNPHKIRESWIKLKNLENDVDATFYTVIKTQKDKIIKKVQYFISDLIKI